MSAHHRRVRNALSRYRSLATVTAATGVCLLLGGALMLMGLAVLHAVALAAMGVMLVAATVPLFSRAATLERQLAQLEAVHERMCELQARRSSPDAVTA